MRLINSHTLALKQFLGAEIPKYAILSHTWEKEEVIFGDWAEIEAMSKQAVQDGLDYLWVDTNCINKSSSAELSEAINSMFAWYRDATVCYAYLADFCQTSNNDETTTPALRGCRWFTRGWTLQELLAPTNLIFYSPDWEALGAKKDLATKIYSITGIPKRYITGFRSIFGASVAERMSWVSRRATTRLEDIAYFMLGLFDINMPLIYGEGSKAFVRLREEIMKGSADETLFCWTSDATCQQIGAACWPLCHLFLCIPNIFIRTILIKDESLHTRSQITAINECSRVSGGPWNCGHISHSDLNTGVFRRASYPHSPIRLPKSLAKAPDSYLKAIDSRQKIFVRMKADNIQMPNLHGHNLLHSRSPDRNSSHEVLLLFRRGSHPCQMMTLPAGRLLRGNILSLQTRLSSSSHQVERLDDMDGVMLQISTGPFSKVLLFFGVRRQRELSKTIWFCKVLDPYKRDISRLSNTDVEELAKNYMVQEKASSVLDIRQEGITICFGEEFDSGHDCRIRGAHIDTKHSKDGID